MFRRIKKTKEYQWSNALKTKFQEITRLRRNHQHFYQQLTLFNSKRSFKQTIQILILSIKKGKQYKTIITSNQNKKLLIDALVSSGFHQVNMEKQNIAGTATKLLLVTLLSYSFVTNTHESLSRLQKHKKRSNSS